MLGGFAFALVVIFWGLVEGMGDAQVDCCSAA